MLPTGKKNSLKEALESLKKILADVFVVTVAFLFYFHRYSLAELFLNSVAARIMSRSQCLAVRFVFVLFFFSPIGL